MERNKQRLLWYVGCFFLTQVLGVWFTLWLAGTPWYMAHAYNPGIRILGYGHWAGRQNCDITIYGDSSAMTALDPAIIQKRTGLKTCNIAEGSPVWEVTGGDPPLHDYLMENSPPRFLVGMWTSSVFRPDQPPFQKDRSDGIVCGLTYGTRRMVPYLLRHREKLLHFAADPYDDIGKGLRSRRSRTMQLDLRAERIARHGQWMFPFPPETQCARQLNPAMFRRGRGAPKPSGASTARRAPPC